MPSAATRPVPRLPSKMSSNSAIAIPPCSTEGYELVRPQGQFAWVPIYVRLRAWLTASAAELAAATADQYTPLKSWETDEMLVRATLLASALAFAMPVLAQQKTTQPKTTLNVGMATQDIGQLDPHFAVSTIDRVPA